MMSLCHILLVLLPAVVIKAEDYHLKYYTDVTLECDEIAHNISATSPIARKYWLFPNGDLYGIDSQSTERLIFNAVNGTISIKRIDDGDFGNYHCIIVHNDKTVSHINHGLNVNGAYFGDLEAKYKRKAVVGGIAAGCLLAVLSSLCLFFQLRYKRRSQRNKAVDELDKAIDGYDLNAYDNVAVEKDIHETVAMETRVVDVDGKADGVTELDQKF